MTLRVTDYNNKSVLCFSLGPKLYFISQYHGVDSWSQDAFFYIAYESRLI